MSNTMTLSGRVIADPELRFIPSGAAVVKIRVADNRRKLNKDTNEWEDDGDPLYIDVIAWKNLAEMAAENVSQKDMIVVSGDLRQRNWETKTGEKRITLELHATDIAVSVKSKKPVGAAAGSQSAELPW